MATKPKAPEIPAEVDEFLKATPEEPGPEVIMRILRLLDEFPPEMVKKKVGSYPRWVRAALKDGSARPEACEECGGFHVKGKGITHLDYVGHAVVTRRLLEIDPLWSWEPVAFSEDGNPLMVKDGQGNPVGLWIRLTILGVTRFGYGSTDPPREQYGPNWDAPKVLIGDALRNAAMRFGVALSLWEDLDDPKASEPKAEAPAQKATPTPRRPPQASPPPPRAQAPQAAPPSPQAPSDGVGEIMCRLCGVVAETTSVKVFPSRYDTPDLGIKVGDPIYRCPDCGKYVPALQAPERTTQDQEPGGGDEPPPIDDDDLPF